MTYKDLERLSRSKSAKYPITSLYLNVNGSVEKRNDRNIVLKGMIKEKKDRGYFLRLSEDAKASVMKDFERIRKYVKEEYDPHGTKSLALFASEGRDLWEYFELGVTSEDTLMVNPYPYIKPLSALLSEHGGHAVILIDRAKAKIFEVVLGEKIGRYEKEDDNITSRVKEAGFGGTEERRIERRFEASLARHFKDVADKAFELYKSRPFNWIFIGGSKDLLNEFENSLHPYLIEKVAGKFHVEPGAPLEEVFDKVSSLAKTAREEFEAGIVENLRDSVRATARGVEGIRACVGAVRQGKISNLVVEQGFKVKGYFCGECDWIGLDAVETCPVCAHDSPEKTIDIVENVVLSTFRTGGSVEHVSVDLSEFGNVGAFLRY